MQGCARQAGISIHALREEGDAGSFSAPSTNVLFLSTPSARRATIYDPDGFGQSDISIHALREEGDLDRLRGCPPPALISIHALREEGDQ